MADLESIGREIADEYAAPHSHPWIIGYSGGKNSTLVAHLVFEHLMSIPGIKRIRSVHIAANDTLVESPLVMNHIKEGIAGIRDAADAFGLPIVVKIAYPEPDKSFWVNVIG